jgi:hypothetical protein
VRSSQCPVLRLRARRSRSLAPGRSPFLQHRGLALGLHALGGDGHVQRLAKPDNARHDGAGLRARAEGVDEGAVDLDLLDRETREIAQARIAGAEIVHGDRHAELIEARQRLHDRLGVLQKDAFGDLELEPMRLKTRLVQHPAHQPEHILGLELGGREVDGKRGVERPGGRVGTGGPEDPFAERYDQAGLLGDRKEGRRRNLAFRRMPPAHQRTSAS